MRPSAARRFEPSFDHRPSAAGYRPPWMSKGRKSKGGKAKGESPLDVATRHGNGHRTQQRRCLNQNPTVLAPGCRRPPWGLMLGEHHHYGSPVKVGSLRRRSRVRITQAPGRERTDHPAPTDHRDVHRITRRTVFGTDHQEDRFRTGSPGCKNGSPACIFPWPWSTSSARHWRAPTYEEGG